MKRHAEAASAAEGAGACADRAFLRCGTHGSLRPAFNLPELMIALVILGLGLLIIAAALPVGLDYNRQSADLSNGAAAGEYAVATIEQGVRLSLVDTRDAFFRPRNLDSVIDTNADGDATNDPEDAVDANGDGALDDLSIDPVHVEPLFKVRAFTMYNADTTPGQTPDLESDEPEELIGYWVRQLGLSVAQTLEYDQAGRLIASPALSPLVRVYPPVQPDDRYTVSSFDPTSYSPSPPSQAELRRALDSRIGWVAFYRRVSYPTLTLGPSGDWAGTDVFWTKGDSRLYEVIVVVTRRPTVEHQYVAQDATATAANWPMGKGNTNRPYRAAPTAWLAWFDTLPTLNGGTDYDDLMLERPLKLNFAEPATLTFRCSEELGALLPKDSIFIPAVNDERPTALNPIDPFTLPGPPLRRAGFVPHAPTTLPIYKVIARPDATTVVVENNGFYPWVASGVNADAWPIWIIPPAVRIDGGQKIFEPASPIVAVERRFVRFRETP